MLFDLWGMLRLKKTDYVVKTDTSARAEIRSGLYEDIHYDGLLLALGHCYKIEGINNPDLFARGKKALIKTNITTTTPDILARWLARLDPRAEISPLARDLSRHIRDNLHLDKYTPEFVTEILQKFYYLKKIYFSMFKLIRPAFLFINSPGDYHMVAAAKELGLKVVEFQHGFLSRNYPGHSWSTYALPYKSRMPLADRIFLYGDYWLGEMAANGFYREELRSVGSLRVDHYLKQEQLSEDDICTLLLTTQGTDTDRLIAWVSEFLDAIQGNLPYRLYIKMHPNYDTSLDKYETAFGANKNVVIVPPVSSLSTFELLKRSHFHLSMYSTCHYEALGLGVPTIVLPLAGHETVKYLYQNGHAFLPKSPQDLAEYVGEWKSRSVSQEVREHYFRTNAVENMKTEMGKL